MVSALACWGDRNCPYTALGCQEEGDRSSAYKSIEFQRKKWEWEWAEVMLKELKFDLNFERILQSENESFSSRPAISSNECADLLG